MMNSQLLATLAVGMIALGILGLIGLWVYSRMKRPTSRAKRRDSDLVVVHRFKQKKRRTLRTALAASAPAMPATDEPADDSRWRQPGVAAASVDPSFRPAMPLYEPDKPRHVFIAHTPSVIIPHETVGPEPRKPAAQLSQVTRLSRRNQPTVLIKAVRVPEPAPKAIDDKYAKAEKMRK